MKAPRRIRGQRFLLYGNSPHAPYIDDLADLEWQTRKRREKTSKRNRGLPGWKRGAASACRVLEGEELEARKQELEARERAALLGQQRNV